MKTRFIIAGIVVATAALAAYLIWFAQPSRASGPLYQNLVTAIGPEAEDKELDAIFAQTLTPDMTLEEKARILQANGFDCVIEPASVIKENSIISCRRPVDGAAGCKGLRYYSYRTAAGETVDANGESYTARRGTFGMCEY